MEGMGGALLAFFALAILVIIVLFKTALVVPQQSAYVVVDNQVGAQHCSMLERIRAEGGRIVISGVPPLNDPSCFHCALDDRINRLLGGPLQAENH